MGLAINRRSLGGCLNLRTHPFFSFDIVATTSLGLSTGFLAAFFANSELNFQHFGIEALPYILIRNELILSLIALFSFYWLMQDLALFSNFFLQCYFITSALNSAGISMPFLLTLAFAFVESSLLVALAFKTRKPNKPISRYLPKFILLIALSSLVEVIVL